MHDAFLRLVNRQRVLLHRVLAQHDLHPAQAMCLRVLSLEEDMSQRDIAAALEISPPTVTRLLQRMERSGLVERGTDPDDARQAAVRLTPAGAGLARLVDRALTEFLDRSLARLPDDDLRELARLMTAWSELADEHPACDRAAAATQPSPDVPAGSRPLEGAP